MSTTYDYYTQLRQQYGGFQLKLFPLIGRGDSRVLIEDNPVILDDNEVFTELPENLNNYYTWAAIKIKPHLKTYRKLSGIYKCCFYLDNVMKASIVINFDSPRDLDSFVFQ